MKNTNLIDKFNAKVFNRLNKDLDNKDVICKMLVNYKWSVKHLKEIDEKYAQNAVDQFNAIVAQFGVKLEEPKKEEKSDKENK